VPNFAHPAILAAPFLVISANERNRGLDTIIAIRVRTTFRDLPTWVRLSDEDRPVVGCAIADDIEQIYSDELLELYGILSQPTMRKVNTALALALDMLR